MSWFAHLIEEILDHDPSDRRPSDRDEKTAVRDALDESTDLLSNLETLQSLDLLVDDLPRRFRREPRRPDRQVDDLVGGIDLENDGLDELAHFREG
jgi:hypothetical protein